jgi:hypothetical protein
MKVRDDDFPNSPHRSGKPGLPNCPYCHGDGFLTKPYDPAHPYDPPAADLCTCVVHREVLANTERGMAGLTAAPPVEDSPLMDFATKGQSVWVTAPDDWMKAHLRHVAIRRPPTWNFKVVSDANLMTAWLATAALHGNEILDPDAITVSMEHATLADLVIPPDLVVLRMGVKAARNAAAAEVLAEALNLRVHEDKPTWVWDTPTHRLMPGHLFFSDAVGSILRDLPHINGDKTVRSVMNMNHAPTSREEVAGRVVLSTGGLGRKSLRKES